ncbi:MAG: hypothetical protein PHD97_03145 [Bacteroidales bacterium]|nr:hypothetical protein [Bacteroidales bacterium]
MNKQAISINISFKKSIAIILMIFLVKLLTVLWLVSLTKKQAPHTMHGIASYSGDASSYIEPVENYLQKKSYYWWNGERKVYAGRTPFYGLFFLFFRLFFSPENASSAVVVLQVLLESLAIFVLSKMILGLFRNILLFWAYVIFMLSSFYVTIYSFYLLTSSMTVSFIIFAVYFYYKYIEEDRKIKYLIASSFFLGYIVSMKPPYILAYLFIVLDLILYYRKLSFFNLVKVLIKKTFIASVPFLILIVPWTIRNYILLKKPILFFENKYAGYKQTKADLECRYLIQAWGESFISWDKKTAGNYFWPWVFKNEYVLPDFVESSSCTKKDIEKTRDLLWQLEKNHNDSLERVVLDRFKQHKRAFISEKPFQYYFLSYLRLIKHYTIHSGSYYLPISKRFSFYKPYQFYIKLFQSLLYYIALLFGIAGLIMLTIKKRKYFIFLLTPLFLIVLYPIIFRYCEARYFMPFYPFAAMGAVYFMIFLIRKIKYFNSFIGKYDIPDNKA